jgi:hypothetical protein
LLRFIVRLARTLVGSSYPGKKQVLQFAKKSMLRIEAENTWNIYCDTVIICIMRYHVTNGDEGELSWAVFAANFADVKEPHRK